VGKTGHVILESISALPWATLDCGQKAHEARHFPLLYVSRYAVVGFASSLPFVKPRIIAEPNETLIFFGKVKVFAYSESCRRFLSNKYFIMGSIKENIAIAV